VIFPSTTQAQKYSYSTNTLSGQLPALPSEVTVYQLLQPSPNLLALSNAEKVASGANFLDNPAELSDTTYRFTKTDPFPTALTMNIETQDFTMTSAYAQDPTVQAALNLPDEGTAEVASKEFFDNFMPLPSYIDSSKTKTTLLAISSTGLTNATSLSTA